MPKPEKVQKEKRQPVAQEKAVQNLQKNVLQPLKAALAEAIELMVAAGLDVAPVIALLPLDMQAEFQPEVPPEAV